MFGGKLLQSRPPPKASHPLRARVKGTMGGCVLVRGENDGREVKNARGERGRKRKGNDDER